MLRGIFHQCYAAWNYTRTAQHRNGKRRDGDVPGIFFFLVLVQFHMGEVCLQHVISDFKDDDTSRNPETIGRDPEKMEQEPAAQGEKYQYDEREGAGF